MPLSSVVKISTNASPAAIEQFNQLNSATISALPLPGVTTGEGVKTIEDFAGYAADDLVGWKERKDGETKTFPGVLADFGVSKADAEQMVVTARLKAGWITEDDLATEDADADETVSA